MKRNRIYNSLILITVVMIVCLLVSGCSGNAAEKRKANEEKVTRAMVEYPGDGLYDPVVTEIGIGVEEPTEEEQAQAEQKAAEEKQAWEDAVGTCFADGMFETFYSKWYRSHVVGMAFSRGMTTTLDELRTEDEDTSDNIENVITTFTATDENGKTRTFEMKWMVIYDKDDPALIQQIKLEDDGGFDKAYMDNFDLGSGLTASEDKEKGTGTLETDYFVLTLSNPSAWDFEQDDNRIIIYNTTARKAGFGGRVMSIEVWEDPNEEPYSGAVPYKSVGVCDGWKIIVTYASDVQYDFSDQEAADEYKAIRSEAETIQEGGTSGPLILK